MIKYVVQIICEKETCGSGWGLKCNTCKEMGTASHVYTFFSFPFGYPFCIFLFQCNPTLAFLIIRYLSNYAEPMAAFELWKERMKRSNKP